VNGCGWVGEWVSEWVGECVRHVRVAHVEGVWETDGMEESSCAHWWSVCSRYRHRLSVCARQARARQRSKIGRRIILLVVGENRASEEGRCTMQRREGTTAGAQAVGGACGSGDAHKPRVLVTASERVGNAGCKRLR
jgi:hypothetical protein